MKNANTKDRTKNVLTLAAVMIAVLGFMIAPASAVPVTVLDPSFETPDIPNGNTKFKIIVVGSGLAGGKQQPGHPIATLKPGPQNDREAEHKEQFNDKGKSQHLW